ncbi:hypothetical protein AALO_G00183670 [Alosa alosa]|uniref:Serine/threonine-protein kinase Nek11 n=2 Tax=Alosa alosa TaxID=278164 RepID=A0AAV6G9Y5_9TELE|nr:serine/threonine-protein kinase Nek11 isoform X1 [Alosa alosa]KAG5271755.1 hypothetical protein AALO_G00183670 [Alosa alosa]
MPRFKERAAQPSTNALNSESVDPDHTTLIAKRYLISRKLGRGSFGTIYLVQDIKAAAGDRLKVLKEIPVGGLKPNETVQANQEAQLLSQLHHPAILKFYTSFLERDSFCIITEYCEDRDLDCKLEEQRAAGSWLLEAQVTEWLIQLLLGVHYMHQRRILHRDLKAKNIFLKKNIVKIGDFGVSCLLMGSCDLATTFTGTPYYMSPEALSQQGYDAKSDIWSLGCVLYEMCCLAHAFEGHNFLSVVMKIVEGESPCLPERYSAELNTLLQRMLVKDPGSRTSAAEALRSKYIEENMQSIKHKFSSMTLQDRTSGGDQDAAQILKAMQRKVHLQTLQQRAEVQKMTPRERMRLRKLQAADEKARKLKQLAEEKYQENCLRMRELRCRHFQTVTVDVLTDTREERAINLHQPAPPLDSHSAGPAGSVGDEIAAQLCRPDLMESDIPEDPLTAEAYYYEDGFESCSEEEEDEMEENEKDMKDEDESNMEREAYDTFSHTYGQDGDLEAMVWHMENVLDSDPTGAGAEEIQPSPRGPGHINTTMARSRIQRMREAVTQRLGEDVFQRVYNYLREARRRRESELDVREALSRMVERPSDCFEVDQLLYYEEQLQEAQGGS